MKKFLHLYSPRGAGAIMRKSVSQRDVTTVEMTPGGHEKPLEADKDQESVPPGRSRVRPYPHPFELPAHEALHRHVPQLHRVPPEGQTTGLGDRRSEVAASWLIP